MSIDPAALAEDAARRARNLARAVGDGPAWAVISWACSLPADPVDAFRTACRPRRLLWRGEAWGLAEGVVHDARHDGAGRFFAASTSATWLRARSAVASSDGAPELPLLLVQCAFEDTPEADGVWGALPGVQVVLPARIRWRRGDGSGWEIRATAVTADDDVEAIVRRLLAEPQPGDRFASYGAMPHATGAPEEFRNRAADAIALLRSGLMRKVVLARQADAPTPADPAAVLAVLARNAAVDTWCYGIDLAQDRTFVGATPEQLFALDGDQLQTMALAGSRPAAGEPASDRATAEALLAATKDRKEHNLVVEHLVERLEPRCQPFSVPACPEVVRLPGLFHLCTRLACRVHHPDPFDLIASLHPTPAIAGLPQVAARSYIARHEGLHRGLYAGVIGFTTANMSRFVVPLRGGVLGPDRAALFAGAGLVESSDPQNELDETEWKLERMRSALEAATS